MDPLTEFHLLLREHGWKPKHAEDALSLNDQGAIQFSSLWYWHHPSRSRKRSAPDYVCITTWESGPQSGPSRPRWMWEATWLKRRMPEGSSVAGLRRRLKQLASDA